MREKSRKQFTKLYDTQEAKQITESKLDDAEKDIEKDQNDLWDEQDGWKQEKVDLLLTRDSTFTAKGDAETKLALAESDLVDTRSKLEAV